MKISKKKIFLSIIIVISVVFISISVFIYLKSNRNEEYNTLDEDNERYQNVPITILSSNCEIADLEIVKNNDTYYLNANILYDEEYSFKAIKIILYIDGKIDQIILQDVSLANVNDDYLIYAELSKNEFPYTEIQIEVVS